MNVEEKAKAFDEALERARKMLNMILDNELIGFPGQIKEIFPQLCESEDERTRKSIIHILQVGGYMSPEEKDKAFAYLEKQKEFLPIPDKFSGLKSLMLQYLQSAANRKDDTEIERDTDLWGRKILDYVWKYSDEQKEKNEITIKQVYKEFINPEKLKDAKTNKYIRAQLFWELAHNGIITAVDYQYLIDDNRKPWTEEEYLKAYRKGFDVSEQLKQKEQKHPNGCFTCDEYKKGYEEGRRNGFTAGYNKAMKEVEQKEQKPLTTEETELNSIAFLEQMGYTCIPPVKEQKPVDNISKEEYAKRFKALCDAYEIKLPNREYDIYHLCDDLSKLSIGSDKQKPVEKQDYSGLNDLERAILRGFLAAGMDNFPVTIIKETAKECLAQIKPAEWSKEDDWKRKELIQYLEEKGDYRTVWMTWLKSLRPSWKPSKEQMEELNKVRTLNPGLDALYQQLKNM